MSVRCCAGALAVWLVVLAAVWPAAPQALGQTNPTEDGGAPTAPSQPGPAGQLDIVRPGDVLAVFVLGEPEVTGLVRVDTNGAIVLPIVGPIPVAGLTVLQASDRVRAALRVFIKDPHVFVSIRQTAPNRQFVYLLGQVNRPGAYVMQDGSTVAEVVAVAGGATSSAALSNALILRKAATIPLDLQRLLIDGDPSANITLEPGDVIIVPETKNRIVIMGAVGRPGPYLFRPGDRLIDVLSAAGGPTQQAAISDIGVIRQAGQKRAVTQVDLDKFYKDGDPGQNVALQAGDIVYVPPRGGVNWSDVLSSLNGLSFLWLLLK